jgi:putative DNA primase/helicase
MGLSKGVFAIKEVGVQWHADLHKKWESFSRRDGDKVALGTLFQMAKAGGWAEAEYHTDLGNARRLIARHGNGIRFIPEWRNWIVWDGTRWRVDDEGAIMRLAKETVESMYAEALKLSDEHRRSKLLTHALKCQAAARLDAMVSLATTEAAVLLPAQRLDADPWMLGLQNGVLDLRTGKFRAAERQDFITMRMSVAFDPEATSPQWSAPPEVDSFKRRF